MKRRKGSLAAKIVVLGLAIPAVINLVSNQIKINDERRQLDQLKAAVDEQRKTNTAYGDALGANEDDDFVRSTARSKLDMAAPGERVFIDISS